MNESLLIGGLFILVYGIIDIIRVYQCNKLLR